MVEGIGLPAQPLWLGENDDAKPDRAGLHRLPHQRLHLRQFFVAVGICLVEASSPITAVRMVECAASTPTLA